MICAIIVAAGKGKRMGTDRSKQFIKLGGKELLAHTLDAFSVIEEIEKIILVTVEEDIEFCRNEIVADHYKKNIHIVAGGAERQQSVLQGLKACPDNTDIVLIHDGARPFVTEEIIHNCIKCAKDFDACTVAVPVKDTIKSADAENNIVKTLKRDELFLIQTPQVFSYQLILKAHEDALKAGVNATDDTLLVERLGGKVKIVRGDYFNIKLTTPEDLIFGTAILNYRKQLQGSVQAK